jgi:LysM repeat protein
VKNIPFKRRLFLLFVIALFALSACERPVPREDSPESVDPAPTSDVIIIPTAPAEDAYPAADEGQPGDGTTDPATTEDTTDTAVPAEETPAETTEETGDTTSEQDVVEAGGEVNHVVQAGETLGYIAQLYGVSLEDIVAANNIVNVDVLDVGQTLIIKSGAAAETAETPPTDGTGEQVHVVQAGENLYRIGLRYGFTPEELASYNNIPDMTRIEIGQIIKIPPK